MLDFLEKVNINKNTINEIYNKNEKSMVYNLYVNSDNCLEIILYFKKLGINNIDELLVNRIEWFLGTLNDMIIVFKNNDTLVSQINEDYTQVNLD